MSTDKEILIKKAREHTGKILYSVIERTITPLEATKFFPKDMNDTSIKIAWHALMHFDADEEIREKDPDYAQEQFLYIEYIAKILSAGTPLPQNMLDEYEKLYIDTILPKKYNWWGIIKSLFRFT